MASRLLGPKVLGISNLHKYHMSFLGSLSGQQFSRGYHYGDLKLKKSHNAYSEKEV